MFSIDLHYFQSVYTTFSLFPDKEETITMKNQQQSHSRRSIRLQGFDYSAKGMYFITICTKGYRIPWFGFIDNGVMILNETGKNAHKCWVDIPKHFPNAVLHNFIVMPDHIHGIIELVNAPVGVQYFEPLRAKPENIEPLRAKPENFEPLRAKPENFEPQREQPRQNHYQKIIPRSIGSIVRGYKTGVTKWFRENATETSEIASIFLP
jgi:putative transposase